MSKYLKNLVIGVLVATAIVAANANAAMYALPTVFKKQVDKIVLSEPVLAPFAYSRFCVHYADECRTHGIFFRRPKPVALTPGRMRDIIEVNRSVNRRIIPTAYKKADYFDSWSIAPKRGDCNDFAVTKRHDLLARGWPSRALLLAEVITPWGDHHLVLVVRTIDRDFVLDNLSYTIRSWSEARYKWVRVQSPYNPTLWSTIEEPSVA